MRIFFALLALAVILADAYTTHRAISGGRRERNKIIRRILGARPQLWLAVAWRLLICGLLFWFTATPWWGWLILAGVFAGGILWNFRKELER